MINQKRMTFGVPSGRTEGVNIPDKGSASPEYALCVAVHFFFLWVKKHMIYIYAQRVLSH